MVEVEVKKLRKEGHSYEEISKIIGRSKKFIWKISKEVEFSPEGKERYYNTVQGIIKRIKNQEEALTLPKVRIIGHCLFDGTVTSSNYNKVVKYINSSKELIDQFSEDVKLVYGLDKTTFEVYPGKYFPIYKVGFSSKLMYEDLGKYFKGYSAKDDKIFIPDIIKLGSKEIRLEFLRAFWEDEGSISAKGRIMGDLKNEIIIRQIVEMSKKFGLNFNLIKYRTYTGDMFKIYLHKKRENLIIFDKLDLFDKSIITHGFNKGKKKSDVLKEIMLKN